MVNSLSDQGFKDNPLLFFDDSIDFMDETLREGAERSSISPSMNERCQLGKKLSEIGLRSLVVGMFPNIPHNIELLRRLLELQRKGEICRNTRFLVISAVGESMRQTLRVLDEIGESLEQVWIMAFHSVSDLQIQHLFPSMLVQEPEVAWDRENWHKLTVQEQKQANLKWLDDFLPTLKHYQGGGVVLGLLDAFRADINHIQNVVELAAKHGIAQMMLVDTAGTCLPQQIELYVSKLIKAYPAVSFYGHFHNDFGMATSNAILGLSYGMKGVDVSVGGFANRAGHPALAETVLALYYLYGITLPDFQYDKLYDLSRLVEKTYGLMESPTQPVTGVITHSILNEFITELVKKAPTIFNVIDPDFVGCPLTKTFGVDSGRNGILQFLKGNEEKLNSLGIDANQDNADKIFSLIASEWPSRSSKLQDELREVISRYHQLLNSAFFTEAQMLEWICDNHRRKNLG